MNSIPLMVMPPRRVLAQHSGDLPPAIDPAQLALPTSHEVKRRTSAASSLGGEPIAECFASHARLAVDSRDTGVLRSRAALPTGFSMWSGVIYDTLLERHVESITLSAGAQIFLGADVQCDFPLGTYLRVTYTEIDGRKLARSISYADSYHSHGTTP